MASNVLIANTDTLIILTVSCFAPKASGEFTQLKLPINASINSCWTCTLTNLTPQLSVSLVWTVHANYKNQSLPPSGVQTLRIVSRNGTLVLSTPLSGITNGVNMTAQVDMASVTIDQRLDFDIVLSTCKDLYLVPHPMSPNVSKPKKKAIVEPKLKEIMSPLLKDIATMNMAFTFGINGSARNVGLWAHQSVLSRQPRIAALISKLKEVESDQASPEALYGVKTTHVTEHSLESYCASIRFIYTSEVKLEVDLEDFAIGYPPNKPLTASCKNRPVIEGLYSPNSSSSASAASDQPVEPRSATTWNELFQIADCYEVTELREYCLEKIVETLDASTALNVLYGFAYRYPDLKEIVLQYVADNMSNMYSESQDPFSAFDSHPERHTLLAEVLQLVFKARTKV